MLDKEICKRCMADPSNYNEGWAVVVWDSGLYVEPGSDSRNWEKGNVRCPGNVHRKIDVLDSGCPYSLEHVISVE